jgi:EpsI family protein
MVPAGDEIVPLLQDLVARFSVALLRWLDIPVFHDGLLITIPAGVFVVAEACAGIRFLIANVMVTALFAYLALDRPWKWVLFLGIGITVPIVANMIRAFGIILIAHLTDGAYAVGVDHLIYGWGFFTAIMLVILWIGSRMADRPIGAFPTPAPLRRPAGPWRASVAAIVLAVGLAPAVYANTVMRPPAAPEPVELASLQVGEGWRRTVAEGWQPHIVGADGLRVERFVGEVGAVDVARAYFAFERQGAEMVHHGHRFVSEAWNRVDGGRIRITTATGPLEARFRVFRVGLESRIVLWWYALDGRLTADPLDLKLAQASQRLRGAFPPAAIVLLSTRFYEDMDAALARLLAFVAAAGKLTPVPTGNV